MMDRNMNTVEKEFSPCGALCAECGQYGSDCSGCADIKGKVYWLEYTGQSVCAVYDCCVNNKKLKNCGACPNLHCNRFTKDPTISDEQNAENLKKMVSRLKGE